MKYDLLSYGDVIKHGDEFLSALSGKWLLLPKNAMIIGMQWKGANRNMLPIRRPIN